MNMRHVLHFNSGAVCSRTEAIIHYVLQHKFLKKTVVMLAQRTESAIPMDRVMVSHTPCRDSLVQVIEISYILVHIDEWCMAPI